MYAEILRRPVFRDDNFKPLASNDPSTSTTGWSNSGLTLSTDGDIMTIGHGGVGNFASKSVFGGSSISTTNWPWVVFRVSGTGVFNFSLSLLGIPVAGPFATTVTSQPQTFSRLMGSGTSFDAISIGTGSVSDSIKLDRIAVCKQSHVQLSQTDLMFGTCSPGSSQGPGYAILRLNNRSGKYVFGGSSSVAPNFGDLLHIYLGQGATLFHAYGGEVENNELMMPPDEGWIQSRGFGLGLMQTIIGNQPTATPIYTAQTPQQLINDFLDNHVNNNGKNGINPANSLSGYQITRSFVQNIGSSIPLYISQFQTAWSCIKEISDLTVAQGTPAVPFVDPAENLHWVPLGGQGAANWTTDPFPANYATSLALGKNLTIYKFRRDVSSLRNRIHYIGISQNPGKYGAWTESAASSWGSERLVGGSTATFSDDTGTVATGVSSVKCILANAGSAHYGGAMFYPAAKNLGLNITGLGSIYSPPIFDFWFRVNQGANCKTTPLTTPSTGPSIFFATDASNRFEYNFVADGNQAPLNAILGIQGINNVTDNYWYHVLLPIGPHGGVQFSSTPVQNTVAPAIYTGASQFQRANVGTPSWSNINYVGVYWEDSGGCPNPSGSSPFWHNGWRILGLRYIIAYDNRAVPPRYPYNREIQFNDPISKDDTSLSNFAIAECRRLRNPIMRASVMSPLLGDAHPEQQVQVTSGSAGLSSTFLRINNVVHRFSPSGMMTDFSISDDFGNSQLIEGWKLANVLAEMGENAVFSRQLFDLKTAILDNSLTPQGIAVN